MRVMTDLTEETYAKNWLTQSEYFYNSKYYSWMVDMLQKNGAASGTLIEIGCGSGYSTLALLEAGYKVICIESNQFCVTNTTRLISKNNKSVASRP